MCMTNVHPNGWVSFGAPTYRKGKSRSRQSCQVMPIMIREPLKMPSKTQGLPLFSHRPQDITTRLTTVRKTCSGFPPKCDFCAVLGKETSTINIMDVYWSHSHHFTSLPEKHGNIIEPHGNPNPFPLSTSGVPRHLREAQVRIFHLTDSYVAMSIISKGRSSARMLKPLLSRLAALLMAFDLYLVISHVESTENPTDHDSRA
jgi:hypothetical protein